LLCYRNESRSFCFRPPWPAPKLRQAPPPQQKKERDLKIEKIDKTAPPTAPSTTQPAAGLKPVVIPRSYAAIVGVSRYPRLPEDKQLQFAERDAQSIRAPSRRMRWKA
jgi:hypothetical protein